MALALPLDLRSLLLIEMVRLRSNLVAKRDQKPDGAEVHRLIHENSVKIWQCLKVSFYMKFWNMLYYFRSGLFNRLLNYLLLVISGSMGTQKNWVSGTRNEFKRQVEEGFSSFFAKFLLCLMIFQSGAH